MSGLVLQMIIELVMPQ